MAADSVVVRDLGIEVVEAPARATISIQLLMAAHARELYMTDDGCLVVARQVRYRPIEVVDGGRALLCARED